MPTITIKGPITCHDKERVHKIKIEPNSEHRWRTLLSKTGMCKNVIPISRPPRSRHVPDHVVVHHPDRRAHLPRLRRLLLLHLPALLLSLRVLPVHLLLLLQLVETGLRKPRNRLENQRETKAKNIVVVRKNEGQPPKCLGNEIISVRIIWGSRFRLLV